MAMQGPLLTFVFCFFMLFVLIILSEKLQFRKFYFSNSFTIARKKCLKDSFKDIIVVLNYNYANYENINIMHELYDNVFGKVISCGPPSKDGKSGPDLLIKYKIWYYRYTCVAMAMQKYPKFKGYLYSNEDVIINWWNLLDLDRNKVWQSGIVDFRQDAYGPIVNKNWMWWNSKNGIDACRKYYLTLVNNYKNDTDIKQALLNYLKNGNNTARCAKGWADTWYVPARYSQMYIKLSAIAHQHQLLLEIASHNILRSLDLEANFEYLNGTYLPDLGVFGISAKAFWMNYNMNLTFIHPIKYHTADREFTMRLLRNWVIGYKRKLLIC